MKSKRVIVGVEGGLVQFINDIPDGVKIEVRDYDSGKAADPESDKVYTDRDGDKYCLDSHEGQPLDPEKDLRQRKQIASDLGLIEQLTTQLYTALPYVEDAKDDEAYKPGVIALAIKTLRNALNMGDNRIMKGGHNNRPGLSEFEWDLKQFEAGSLGASTAIDVRGVTIHRDTDGEIDIYTVDLTCHGGELVNVYEGADQKIALALYRLAARLSVKALGTHLKDMVGEANPSGTGNKD